MSRARLIEDFTAATADLTNARLLLQNEEFRARHGMANNILHATQVEHSAYHRWLRIGQLIAAHR